MTRQVNNKCCYAKIETRKRLIYYYYRGDYKGKTTKIPYRLGRYIWHHLYDRPIDTFLKYIKMLEDEFISYRLVRTNNIHKGKAPINKESIKTIKKKHTLWTLYIETKRGILNVIL